MSTQYKEKMKKMKDVHGPIKLHPDNPHYFIYKGHPTILVTAGEHYGAVVNLDFDYIPYLNTLKEFGLNLIRVFSGAYIENENDIDWMKYDNNLAPRPMRLLAPWKRSTMEGYPTGGCRFDLDQWDEEYFDRLKDLIIQADQRGIIVEYVFFSQMYGDKQWGISPLNTKCNINEVGKCTWDSFLTLEEAVLVKRQEDLIRKVSHELNQFDNLYYEICNEPNNTSMGQNGIDWHNRMIETLLSEEVGQSGKHLIAVNYDNPYAINHIHPAASINNVHYTWGDFWVGAMELIDNFYDQPHALAMDETDGLTRHLIASEGRMEAWEALVGGCAVYNNLSWGFTTTDSKGSAAGHRTFLFQLSKLKEFMESLDFERMKADRSVIAKGVYEDAHARILVEPGRQYAFYVHHGKRAVKNFDTGYTITEGVHQLQLGLWIPEGSYIVQWIEPSDGKIIENTTVEHTGTIMELKSPEYRVDIALRIKSRK